MSSDVRVRFCPSPTGNPHVGMVRTALFNWAFARHHGGTFVFRIEDTDAERDSEDSYLALLDSLRWLGLDWDEGPEVGGPYAPYRQSERLDIYADVVRQLLDAGLAYPCYCTPAELEERREQARKEGRTPGYDGHCRDLTADQCAALAAEGREAAIRLRMPDQDWTWDDLVRGEVTFGREHVPDYVIVRANGDPLYTLVNPVDDALMRITHVLRGEDLLSSTPRQLAMYQALAAIGVGDGGTPRFGHLPYVMGEGNKKLSKRDPESSLLMYREQGYLPEALLNYLALLGWSMGEDREFFSLPEMAEAFDVSRVSPNPARFDLKKCTAINGDWIRSLAPEEIGRRIVPFLQRDGLVEDPISGEEWGVLMQAVPLVQERMETLGQAEGMLGFLFVSESAFAIDPDQDIADEQSQQVIAASLEALNAIDAWDAPTLEAALRAALIDGLGLKPKVAFGAVRVAVTGRRVSPPLFESLEILGRERTLGRLTAARTT
ncbi:MAG: glutamate--tRNA ligase [Actinomycetales bacterium mxb001]|nr:MAG: glutamate--tRNA ligase [Actinomycetales bacterium mxb001]